MFGLLSLGGRAETQSRHFYILFRKTISATIDFFANMRERERRGKTWEKRRDSQGIERVWGGDKEGKRQGERNLINNI